MESVTQSTVNSKVSNTITTSESKISYAVSIRINSVDDNGNSKQVFYLAKMFDDQPYAIDSRKQAMEYFQQILSEAKDNQKIYGEHFDFISPVDHISARSGKELIITLKCIDQPNGKSFAIADTNWFDQPSRFLPSLEREIRLHQGYGCDTFGEVSRAICDDGRIITFLNTPHCKQVQFLYYIAATNHHPSIIKNGINADRDGYIRLLSNKDASDIVAMEKLRITGEYIIIKVSIDGITAKPELEASDNDFYASEVKIRQNFIAPEYIISGEFGDTTNPNRILINRGRKHYHKSA